MTKARRLREALQQSLASSGHAGIQSPPLGLWQLNESSPSSTMNQDNGLDSISKRHYQWCRGPATSWRPLGWGVQPGQPYPFLIHILARKLKNDRGMI